MPFLWIRLFTQNTRIFYGALNLHKDILVLLARWRAALPRSSSLSTGVAGLLAALGERSTRRLPAFGRYLALFDIQISSNQPGSILNGQLKRRDAYLLDRIHVVKPSSAGGSASLLTAFSANLSELVLRAVRKVSWVGVLGTMRLRSRAEICLLRCGRTHR
jgi:hypothetical protein